MSKKTLWLIVLITGIVLFAALIFSPIAMVVLFVLLAAAVYYRTAATSKYQSKRIIDLVTVGMVLSVSAKLKCVTSFPVDPLELSGAAIFLYGWGILIMEKFYEGLRGQPAKDQ